MNKEELLQGLRHFTGSDEVFHHNMNRHVNYTEGVRFFAQQAGGGAYWLLDILATQPEILRAVKDDEFVVVMLQVAAGKGVLTVARDLDQSEAEDGTITFKFADVRYVREIDYTDCPEGDWKFYMAMTAIGNAIAPIIMLPREY